MFILGITMAYYLPFIPLIQWVSAMAGYVLFLFEAVFGCLFWAAAHAMPEGEGIAGQHAKQGYMLVLALLVRPALMILGLIGGMVLSAVLVNFAGELASPYLQQVHGNNAVGLIGWIAGLWVMALITLTLVRRSFNLMFELPDRIVRWIGHSGEHLGENQDEPDNARRFFAAFGRFEGMKGATPLKDPPDKDPTNEVTGTGVGKPTKQSDQ